MLSSITLLYNTMAFHIINPSKLLLTYFIFLVIFLKFRSYSCVANNLIFCPEIEKQALLNFKQSLKDPMNFLSSWNSEFNCCKWKGVACNHLTGHVDQLRLRDYELSGRLTPSLCYLKHLRYFDLSGNDFFGKTIPSFIGSFSNLEYLNLTHTKFHGTIPHIIGNLSTLHTLSIESEYDQAIEVDSLTWLSNLYRLEYLNMNSVNLSKASNNWVHVINQLPSLVELHLQSCSLNFIASLDVVNVTSLTVLNLPFNSFESSLPTWILQLNNLRFLNLSWSEFEGPIPKSMNATNLQDINLSDNYFNSTIPDWLYSCKDIYSIDFGYNFLHGTISSCIGNLSSLNTFNLNDNDLSGRIPLEIGSLSKLLRLRLSGNNFQGEIPYSLGNLSNLVQLYLSSNKLMGNLPESLGRLHHIEYVTINSNMFEGKVNENHFVNLTKLIGLIASKNHLAMDVKPNWVPPFQLRVLKLRSWNLGAGTEIPSWLQTQKNLNQLDLSDTGISGTIPSWILNIEYVDLSHNNFDGKVPNFDHYRGLKSFLLSSNQYNGSLPRVSNTLIALDLSHNSFTGGISNFLCDRENHTYSMTNLLLGGNQLSGKLPDCWMNWQSLRLLNLSNNNLSGNVPNSIGSLVQLKSLNLYGNKLSGPIPDSLMNSTSLLKIDLSDNDLSGNIPAWIGTSLTKLRFLILRSNKLSGEIPLDVCHLEALQVLDISDNKFSGIIPRCLDNLTAMATKLRWVNFFFYFTDSLYFMDIKESALVKTKGTTLLYDTTLSLVTNIDLSKNNLSGHIPKELTSLVELRSLNLSDNRLTGSIPCGIGNMKQLESLDLSRNALFGEIPNTFTVMSSLNYLNLSHNNLTGKIPESTQMQLMDPSGFVGNSLCGPPLTNKCDDNHDQFPKPTLKANGQDEKSEAQWLYVFVSLGYAMGLSAVFTVLVLKKTWRDALFRFVEDVWNEMYVYFYIIWKRLQRK